MNQVEESWPAGALEGLSSIQPLVGALGPNRARLCLVDFKWQGLRRHPKAAIWRRRWLQLASEIPMWKGPLMEQSVFTLCHSVRQSFSHLDSSSILPLEKAEESFWVGERGRCSRWGNGDHGLDPSPRWRKCSAIKCSWEFDSYLRMSSFIMKKDWRCKSRGFF